MWKQFRIFQLERKRFFPCRRISLSIMRWHIPLNKSIESYDLKTEYIVISNFTGHLLAIFQRTFCQITFSHISNNGEKVFRDIATDDPKVFFSAGSWKKNDQAVRSKKVQWNTERKNYKLFWKHKFTVYNRWPIEKSKIVLKTAPLRCHLRIPLR